MIGARETPTRILHCYASGGDGDWEGICLDLDIAVQAESFGDVLCSLHDAVSLYLETVTTLPEEQRGHLLHRPAPLGVQLKFLGYALRSAVKLDSGDGNHHPFTMPLAA